jgi:DNA polymerase bacteriophage-type
MSNVYGDIETFSQLNLKESGAYVYATDASTGLHFFCYALDDGEVQVWRPGNPVPEPFTAAAVAHNNYSWWNWSFERNIYAEILVPRHGFAPIPLENQDCAQRRALANAYPAELGLCCEALGLPYRKDHEARKAMLRLAQPKKHKYKTPEAREQDLGLLLRRCISDVESLRACYCHPRMHALSTSERPLLLLDAKVNNRGVRLNVPFVEAGRALAVVERNAVNVRLSELTSGAITSVFQRDRILAAVNACGHSMTKLSKRAVAATLAHKLEDHVRELLVLRQRGALNSALKFKRMLAFADPTAQRLHDTLRYHGAHTGRWSSIGPQVHNMKRNDAELPASLVNAVLTGDRAELARWGNPLNVLSGLMRAALCAADGHKLYWADFAAIESRVLAWFAGEEWKLAAFREYDASGDERLHPYRQIAARMLRKDVLEINKSERQKGKSSELACGYGGSVGAWRNIIEDPRSDAEIKADIWQWREAHPQTRVFWDRLGRAVRIAVRSGQAIRVNPAPAPSVIAAFDGYTLTLELPSGRIIPYPGARLVPNNKFEDGDSDVEYLDNSKGLWRYKRAWFGIFVENVVSGAARDLLADALLRADARGWKIVFHCHDEITIEAPDGVLSEQDLLALMLEPPVWNAGLPLGGKAHSGPIYFEGPAIAEPPAVTEPREVEVAGKIKIEDETEIEVEHALDAFIAEAPSLPNTKEVEQGAAEMFLANLDANTAPLTALVSLPMDSSNRVSCPFHDDLNPSCSIYPDHFFCHACQRRGDRINWLMQVEGMSRAEAMESLYAWDAPPTPEQQQSEDEKLAFVREIWNATQPLAGTIGEKYLAETRGIAIDKLPPTIKGVLRFHRNCVFGAGERHPCIVALMRDPLTDAAVGVHRIGLRQENGAVHKIDRKALGHMGVVKLWPVEGSDQLVIGEGIETVLAAATRIPYRGAALTPAWSAVARGGLGRLPVLPGVQSLILLVDNDANGEGQKAAERCRQAWRAAGRAVAALVPKQAGWDFNDVVLRRRA